MNSEPATLLTTKVPKRVMILNVVQIIGLLAVALAFPSAEMKAFLEILPDALAENIGKIAIGLLALKPVINTICDLIDNGKLDKSWGGQRGADPDLRRQPLLSHFLPYCRLRRLQDGELYWRQWQPLFFWPLL